MKILAILVLAASTLGAVIQSPPATNCAQSSVVAGVGAATTAAFGTFGSNCVTPASNVAGRTLVAFYFYQAATLTASLSATDTQGNTYLNGLESGPYDGTYVGFFFAPNIIGGAGNQVTVNLDCTSCGGGGGSGISAFSVYTEEWAGVATSSILDAIANGNGFSTSLSMGLTTVSAGDLIIAAINANASLGTVSAGSGYTLGYQANTSAVTQAQVAGAPGSYTAQINWTGVPGPSTNVHVVGVMLALKPASTAAVSFTVWHINNGALAGSTTWSPDGWGDGTSSTSTGGLSGALANACAASNTLDQITLHHTTVYAQPTTSSTLTIPSAPTGCGILVTGDVNGQVPPTGTRVCTGACPTPPAFLPQIQALNNSQVPLLTPAPGAHDFEFHAVAFVQQGGNTSLFVPLVLGAGLNNSLTTQTAGKRWVFSSIWAAGNYNQPGPARGFVFEAADSIIRDSYLDEFGNYGQDLQAILSTSSSNLLVMNNWIAATTENYMCGGSNTSIPGVICNHNIFIGNYFPKHIQWRVYASNTTPAIGDLRPSCLYYPPDNGYDGTGGGEIWVNGTNSLTQNGAFPPGSGTFVNSGTATFGQWWECGPSGTWVGPNTPQNFTSKYGTAIQGGGNGNEKNTWEMKYGHHFHLRGNVFANMWASAQNELLIMNGPLTNATNTTRGTHNVLIEYNVFRDSVSGLSSGAGFVGPPADPLYGIIEQNNLLDNVTQAIRNCLQVPGNPAASCTYNNVPAQAKGLTVFGGTQTYNGSNPGNLVLMRPGGWVLRHNTAVNSAVNTNGAIDIDTNVCIGTACSSTSVAPANPVIGDVFIDNVFTLGGGVGGQGSGGSTASQIFNVGGAFFGGGSPQPTLLWAPGSTLANNVISEDTAEGGNAFSGTTGLLGTNGPGLNGMGQGTTIAPGRTATSSCCFNNYLPAVQPTNAGIATPAGTPATWNSGTSSWTYPDYTLSASGTACNPAGTNTTGAPTGACAGAATDGTDPGADIQTVMGFTGSAISGAANPNQQFRISYPIKQSSTSVLVQYIAPLGATSCTVVVSPNETLTSPTGSHSPGGTTPNLSDTITGLSSSVHFFWGSVACPDQANAGKTLTLRFQFEL